MWISVIYVIFSCRLLLRRKHFIETDNCDSLVCSLTVASWSDQNCLTLTLTVWHLHKFLCLVFVKNVFQFWTKLQTMLLRVLKIQILTIQIVIITAGSLSTDRIVGNSLFIINSFIYTRYRYTLMNSRLSQSLC